MIDPTTLIQLIIMGIMVGTVYAPITLGFNIIYKSSKVVNFAQGEILLVGSYLAYTFAILSAPNIITGFLIAICLAGIIGVIIERLILRPLIARPILAIITATIGLSSVLYGLTQVIWGPAELPAPRIFPIKPIKIGPISLPVVYIYSSLVSVILIIIFMIFYSKTNLGISMKAAADDQEAALSLGVSIKTVFRLAWALSAMASTVSGILLMNIFGFVSYVLAGVILIVFTAAILGGLDSVEGAIIGSILIGVLYTIGGIIEPYIGPGFKEVFPFIIILIFMLFKPYGLFGTEEVERL